MCPVRSSIGNLLCRYGVFTVPFTDSPTFVLALAAVRAAASALSSSRDLPSHQLVPLTRSRPVSRADFGCRCPRAMSAA